MSQSLYEIIEAFKTAMFSASIHIDDDIIPDAGKITRARVKGDGKSKNAWYILHTDGVASGSFGYWKTGQQETWCSKKSDSMTQAERQAFAKRCADDKATREADAVRAHNAAADVALMTWEAATPCDDHPYLTRKRVAGYGLRVGRYTKQNKDTGEIWLDVPDALLIPVKDGKKLVSLQAIFTEKQPKLHDRDKDFIAGGKKRGCYFVIGELTDRIIFCEGYATGATIHEATGHCVVVCFDANNIGTVVARFREKFGQNTFIIAADNDQFTVVNGAPKNVGVDVANAAAAACRAWVAVPRFTDLSSKPTDFNDLFILSGLRAVADQIDAAVPDVSPVATELPSVDYGSLAVVADYISLLPMTNSKGKPQTTIENLVEICRRLEVVVRYNVIKKDVQIVIKNESFTVDNEQNASLAWLTSQCQQFNYSSDKLSDYLCYIGDKNQFNPVATWITSKPWDGVSRIQSLLDTVTIENAQDPKSVALKDAMIRKWMLSAVAASFNHQGVSAHGVLVFQGEQYVGKTKWFKTLVPETLGVLQDGLSLRPDDRDSVKQVLSYWLVELGELDATFRKSDIAALKAFLTRDKDVLRRAYAKNESNYARRTVFFASVNPRQFLHDPTGNRRYWTVSCAHLDHSHNIDMQQVWAEVYEASYKANDSWFLGADEMGSLKNHNEDFEVLDPIAERIQSKLEWSAQESDWIWHTATDVLSMIGYDRPTQSDATKCGTILGSMNGGRRKRTSKGNLLLVPPKTHGF